MRLCEDGVDGVTVAGEVAAELATAADKKPGEAEGGGRRLASWLVQRAVFDRECDEERGEDIVGEVDDDQLARGEETSASLGSHRFLGGGLGLVA